MDHDKAQIAAQLRRRAFQSRDAEIYRKLNTVADQVPLLPLPNARRVAMRLAAEARKGDTPQLRTLRKRKRWLDMARPLTRHPRVLDQLGELLPRARGRPAARLREDLHMDDDEIQALAVSCEEAFGIHIDLRTASEWEDLNDVCSTIAGGLATDAA